MAEEQFVGEKSEPATPRKRQEAREKGNVARSQDLSTALLLVAGCLAVFFLAGWYMDRSCGVLLRCLEDLGEDRLDQSQVVVMTTALIGDLLVTLAPVAAVALVVALAVNFLQVGFLVTTRPLEPDLSRLHPAKGFQRIFSRRGLMRFLFGLVKLTVLGAILMHGFDGLIAPHLPDSVLQVMHIELPDAVNYSVSAVFGLGMKAAVALLVLALFDLAFQRWQFEKDLMMTRQEVREELKRMEGDPKLKERRRRIQQRLALQRMMQDVPRADVVITNPTHVACALRYDEATMHAPRLLAKGRGVIAHRIREIAAAHDVPIVEQPPLARLIESTTEAGQEVPPELYGPVAEVLAYVYGLRQRPAAGARGAP